MRHASLIQLSPERMKPGYLSICLLAVFFALCERGSCALIALDHFSYSTGAVSGLNGGSGFAGVYTGTGQINSGNLLYTDPDGVTYKTSGSHISTTTNGTGMFRVLNTSGRPAGMLDSNSLFGANGSRVYLGFLVRLDSGTVNAYGDYGGISLFLGSTEELFIGDLGWEGTHNFWGIDPQTGSSTGVFDSTVPVSSTVHLLVARIDFASGNETIRFMWIPPWAPSPPRQPSDRLQRLTSDSIAFGFKEAEVVVTVLTNYPWQRPTSRQSRNPPHPFCCSH